MSLISLDHVLKVYPRGSRPALDYVSLDVDRGDFVFLVGASGSGKTTLLSLLLREEEANDGEIHVAGNDLRRLSSRQVPQYRRSLGFIFQDYKLLNNKTVYQNVAFALEVIGTSRATIRLLVPRVLETVGLSGKENNYPHELSGGEAQRVAIARAYVNHPQILLADEPTGNLDPTTSLGIMEVLDAINRTGTTIVMATHNEEIVNSMRKRVVELHAGKIVRDEREGSYDSALYFPDADVEKKSKAQNAVENSNQQESKQEINNGQETNKNNDEASALSSMPEHSEKRKRLSKKAQRVAIAREAVDMVTQSLQSDSAANEGIARLAKSVHSGRTGRYGEVFQSLETTMTWGRGLVSVSDDQKDSNIDNAGGDDSADNSGAVENAVSAEGAEGAVSAVSAEGSQISDSAEQSKTLQDEDSAATSSNLSNSKNEVEENVEEKSESDEAAEATESSKAAETTESSRATEATESTEASKAEENKIPLAPPKPPVFTSNNHSDDNNQVEGAE